VSYDVVLVGPYPPPFGGISSHVRELAAALERRGHDVAVINHFGHAARPPVVAALHRNPIRYYRELSSVDATVLHYHHARVSTTVATALATRRLKSTRLVMTVHGHELDAPLTRWPGVRWLTRWAVGRFDHLVAVSDAVAAELRRHVDPARVTVLPAHLAAPQDSQSSAHADALQLGARSIAVSAYRIDLNRDGQDLYGLDIAIDVFERVAERRPDLEFAIFLAQSPRRRSQKRYLDRLLERTEIAGFRDRLHVLVGADLRQAMPQIAVYLRPTRSDGDAVSIREAKAAGTPVVASDAVLRPDGVVTVGSTDIDAWTAEIDTVLHRPREIAGGGALERWEEDPAVDVLLAVYSAP
jgi:glycosyltransferase involved in cell wall biosynthesis